MLILRWENPSIIQSIGFKNTAYIELDSKIVEKFWTPDLYFPNEKKANYHDIMFPNKMLKIHQNGTIDYISRLSLTLNCLMILKDYPFDKQNCSIEIMSFSYTSDVIELLWDDLDVNPNVELPQFQLRNHDTAYCNNQTRKQNQLHSCLRADFIFVRNIGYYIVQMYIPCILVVTLSWISFWLNVNSVPGRISLGVLTVLTITTQSSTINASLPRVSYTKAIDIYLSTCLVFVFSALIEFAVANVLSRNEVFNGSCINKLFRKKKGKEKSKNGNYSASDSFVRIDGEVRLDMPQENKPSTGKSAMGGKDYASYLDIGSRVFFPATFIIFNVVYWFNYMEFE